MIELNTSQPVILDNCICIYCAVMLDAEARTKEHVIGRKFVPKGTLNGSWNLIANACLRCNGLKADLENDISAITMLAGVTGPPAHANLRVAEIAHHKAAGAISRHTRRPVRESREELNVQGRLGENISMTFGLVGHPHIDDNRAFELASMHLTAFFFFITYDKKFRRGYYWHGRFQPLLMVRHEDWGNERIRAFSEAVKTWPASVCSTTADGYFKLSVRRHPSAECWSWAIEWNRTTRLIGFFGDQDAADAMIAGLPTLPTKEFARRSDGVVLRMRPEKTLDSADDILFALD